MALTRTRRGGRSRSFRHRGGNSAINGDSGFPSNWCNPSQGVARAIPYPTCGEAKAGGGRKSRRHGRKSRRHGRKSRRHGRKSRRHGRKSRHHSRKSRSGGKRRFRR